jgi:hypothetical protein
MIKGLKEFTSRVCVMQVVGAMSQCYSRYGCTIFTGFAWEAWFSKSSDASETLGRIDRLMLLLVC